MPGGVGYNWFEVELTSEHVETGGEGGVGHNWFTVELTSEHVEPPVTPEGPEIQVGGGTPDTLIGGPLTEKFTIELPGVVTVSLPIVVGEFDGIVTGTRTITTSVPAVASASRQLSVQLSGIRGPAEHWNFAIQDEEELLLLL